MHLTDTHAHLYWDSFNKDRDAVLARCAEFGVMRVLVPGTTLKTSLASVELAESHRNLFAAIGIHPTDALEWDENTKDALKKTAKSSRSKDFSPSERLKSSLQGKGLHPKIKAIGEIGLDYYWERAPHDLQKRVLQEQLSLAEELKLPVVLHLREKDDALEGNCSADLLGMLEKWVTSLRSRENPLAKSPGVLHSFSGTREVAQTALQLGFLIGVTGPVTFKKADARREVIASIPLNRILIETDAPFLAPHPKRGRRNEPSYVRFVAKKLAELHHKTMREIAETTTANAARLFNW